MPADLGVTACGLNLKNPVIAGSGESTMDLQGLKAALESGAAAVVAKSANESPEARRQLAAAEYVLLDERWRPLPPDAGAPTPRAASLFCRSGLVQAPFGRWVETLVEADRFARARDAYVVGSLIVSDPSESVRMAGELEAAGLRWLELNVGAPHGSEAAPGAIRSATDGAGVEALVGPVRAAVSVPLTVKLGSEGDPLGAADAAFRAGANAVCLAGRHLAFLPDIETRRPVLGTYGAIGGAWALPLTLRWIAKARQRFGPGPTLLGTNGARDGLDVARFLLAGASAVEMTTAVVTDGPAALTKAIDELRAYLHDQKRTAAALVGEAADQIKTYAQAGEDRAVAGGER
jgi:dihydroorotate dehydrogenase (NAD+) catalytic subunit